MCVIVGGRESRSDILGLVNHSVTPPTQDVGVDCQGHLNLRQVPEDLLPALENHISDMDSIKKATTSQPRCNI